MGLDTLDETKPADTDPVSLGDDSIRETRASIKQSFGIEHFLTGHHRFLMGDAAARPSAGYQGRLYINTSNNTIEYDNGANWVSTGAVIVPGSVGRTELTSDCIDSSKIINGSVSTDDLANSAITTIKLADGSITTAKLAQGAVGPSQLVDGSVTTSKIAGGAVGPGQIADGACNINKIPTSTIIPPGSAMGATRSGVTVGAGTWQNNLAPAAVTLNRVQVVLVSVSVHATFQGGNIYLQVTQNGTQWAQRKQFATAGSTFHPATLAWTGIRALNPGSYTYAANVGSDSQAAIDFVDVNVLAWA